MPEQVYNRDELRKRVLELLRQRGTHQSTLQVSHALGVQYWAVEQALEDAWQARDVSFQAGAGWLARGVPKAGPRPVSDDAQTPLGV